MELEEIYVRQHSNSINVAQFSKISFQEAELNLLKKVLKACPVKDSIMRKVGKFEPSKLKNLTAEEAADLIESINNYGVSLQPGDPEIDLLGNISVTLAKVYDNEHYLAEVASNLVSKGGALVGAIGGGGLFASLAGAPLRSLLTTLFGGGITASVWSGLIFLPLFPILTVMAGIAAGKLMSSLKKPVKDFLNRIIDKFDN